jgi:hypothetical protein
MEELSYNDCHEILKLLKEKDYVKHPSYGKLHKAIHRQLKSLNESVKNYKH